MQLTLNDNVSQCWYVPFTSRLGLLYYFLYYVSYNVTDPYHFLVISEIIIIEKLMPDTRQGIFLPSVVIIAIIILYCIYVNCTSLY